MFLSDIILRSTFEQDKWKKKKTPLHSLFYSQPRHQKSFMDTYQAAAQLAYYGPIVLFSIGIPGAIFNVIMFVAIKIFRKSSTSYYVISQSFAHIIALLIVLLQTIPSTSASASSISCKSMVFIAQFIVPCAMSYLCLIAFDRWACTSPSARILTQPIITTTTTTSTTTTTTVTTTTATTTTTVTSDLCSMLEWNQTGLLVACTGVQGSGDDTFKNSACIYVDENYTMYICDHHNERIQMWFQGATKGVPRAGSSAGAGATPVGHAEYLTMDKKGYIYVAGHTLSTAIRFAPGSIVGTIAANQLKESSDVAVDDNFNLYVADPKNQRIMKWAQNATSGTVFADHSYLDGVYGILLAQNSSNQLYLSAKSKNSIYLWTFGATSPSLILHDVNSTNQNTLKSPLGMAYDNSSNLYVADSANNRVVMFPADSTVGVPIIGECNAEPLVTSPMDVAFDKDQNLYVVLDGNKVLKYSRI